jgi:hypothetical protein
MAFLISVYENDVRETHIASYYRGQDEGKNSGG